MIQSFSWSIEPNYWRDHKQLLVYSGWKKGCFIRQQNNNDLYEGTYDCTKDPPDIRTAHLEVLHVHHCKSWSDAIRSIMMRCEFRQPFPTSRTYWMHMNRELTDWLDAYKGGSPYLLNMRMCLGRRGELSAKGKDMVVAAMNKDAYRRGRQSITPP